MDFDYDEFEKYGEEDYEDEEEEDLDEYLEDEEEEGKCLLDTTSFCQRLRPHKVQILSNGNLLPG